MQTAAQALSGQPPRPPACARAKAKSIDTKPASELSPQEAAELAAVQQKLGRVNPETDAITKATRSFVLARAEVYKAWPEPKRRRAMEPLISMSPERSLAEVLLAVDQIADVFGVSRETVLLGAAAATCCPACGRPLDGGPS